MYNSHMRKINLAIVGLNFGREFANVYAKDERINRLVVCDLNEDLLSSYSFGDRKIEKVNSLDKILDDPEIDAVHLLTPIPLHAKQIIQVLSSGKHCACAVPMALTIEELDAIIEAKKKSKKRLMLMETSAYTYQMFYIRDQLQLGNVGKIQFLRGSHYQDMRGWANYWKGFPPMLYGTHAVSPLRLLASQPIQTVSCHGSGSMDEELRKQYNNPYPFETVTMTFKDSDIVAEASRSLFETCRPYQEGLFVYGSNMSFEWGFHEDDPLNVLIQKDDGVEHKQMYVPNHFRSLPAALKHFTKSNIGGDFSKEEMEVGQGAPHHGSHPHLVNEFLNLVIKNKQPYMNLKAAINVTAACIYAHQSAVENGKTIKIPKRFQ